MLKFLLLLVATLAALTTVVDAQWGYGGCKYSVRWLRNVSRRLQIRTVAMAATVWAADTEAGEADGVEGCGEDTVDTADGDKIFEHPFHLCNMYILLQLSIKIMNMLERSRSTIGLV